MTHDIAKINNNSVYRRLGNNRCYMKPNQHHRRESSHYCCQLSLCLKHYIRKDNSSCYMRPNQHHRGESYINKGIVISTFIWYNRLNGRSVDRSCRMVGRSGGYVSLAGWLVGRQESR